MLGNIGPLEIGIGGDAPEVEQVEAAAESGEGPR